MRRFGLAPLLPLLPLLPLMLAPALAHAEEPTRVWVFFTDHGRSPAQLEAELATRRAELGPRTLARRAKVRGAALVDEHDLPPAPIYVDAVTRSGAELRVESRWLNAVSVDADPETQRALAALPFVRGLHPVGRAQARPVEITQVTPGPLAANPDDYGLSWDQLEAIGVHELHDCGLTGAGVIMAVQDTGFLLDHQAFSDTVVLAARDFVDGDDEVGPETGDEPNQHHHGTWVLATITGDDPGMYRGVAPGISVILSKTEDMSTEEPFEEDLYVEGLEWVESMGVDIFSASLGYFEWYTPDQLDGASAVTTVAVELAVANGLIVFTSMGNAGPDPTTLGAPADSEAAISLGAINVDGELAEFSSRGPTADGRIKPDVLAPGWDIATIEIETLDGYNLIDGTSFSTPIAAGVGALLLEAYPWLTPADMAELMRTTASQADAPDNDWGYGILNAAAAGAMHCGCVDLDGDHYYDVACGGTDCDDADPGMSPGVDERCNGVDDSCDGVPGPEEVDADADGFMVCAGDCDDASPGVNPDATELCNNGIDDDCDGVVDGEDPDCGGPGDGDGDSAGDGDGDGDGDSSSETGAGESGDAKGSEGGGDEAGCACSTGGTDGPHRRNAAWLLVLLAVGPLGRRRQRER